MPSSIIIRPRELIQATTILKKKKIIATAMIILLLHWEVVTTFSDKTTSLEDKVFMDVVIVIIDWLDNNNDIVFVKDSHV
mmetsp:Transcript_8962/g.8706  ORF Transcript_8962/g.8706 Transcript_8962/m.8706 type:complete len:80 (-) Transcript_8962:30-269(-)